MRAREEKRSNVEEPLTNTIAGLPSIENDSNSTRYSVSNYNRHSILFTNYRSNKRMGEWERGWRESFRQAQKKICNNVVWIFGSALESSYVLVYDMP